MFSHVVIFWTKPDIADAPARLLTGAKECLIPIPGVELIHIGEMVTSPRPVVDQSYQVALNIVFPDKAAHDTYQAHPLHQKFVAEYFKPLCDKLVVYDFA